MFHFIKILRYVGIDTLKTFSKFSFKFKKLYMFLVVQLGEME